MIQTMSDTNNSNTLSVNTSRFGTLKVDKEKVISMTSPLLGFPESSRFFLKPHSSESPFMWFQSIDEPHLAFVVIQAGLLVPGYQPEIPSAICQELHAEDRKGLDILLILTIPKNRPQEMTANLLGPLVINPEKRLAKQALLDPAIYDPCWPVFTDDGT